MMKLCRFDHLINDVKSSISFVTLIKLKQSISNTLSALPFSLLHFTV